MQCHTTSRTYRVLIASPSDVEDGAGYRGSSHPKNGMTFIRIPAMLCSSPVRWETHTAPQFGSRPQEIINQAIVDNCDFLLGIFWTRIGTSTGTADSGTLEEIERVANAGKPVMLYFSKIGADPDQIDLTQLDRLQAFKQQTYANALTETFKSQMDFHDKLTRQLELKVRELEGRDRSRLPPPLSLIFALDNPKRWTGSSVEGSVEIIEIADMDLSGREEGWQRRIRESVAAKVRAGSGAAVLLAIRNSGSSGVRNLFVEMSISASSNEAEVTESLITPRWTSFTINNSDLLRNLGAQSPTSEDGLTQIDDRNWELKFEWDALQPQRVRAIRPLYIVLKADTNVQFMAKVFADKFAEPVVLSADLSVKVRAKKVTLADLIPDLDSLKHDPRLSLSSLGTHYSTGL